VSPNVILPTEKRRRRRRYHADPTPNLGFHPETLPTPSESEEHVDAPRRRLQQGKRHPQVPSPPAQQKPGRIFIRIIDISAPPRVGTSQSKEGHTAVAAAPPVELQSRGLRHPTWPRAWSIILLHPGKEPQPPPPPVRGRNHSQGCRQLQATSNSWNPSLQTRSGPQALDRARKGSDRAQANLQFPRRPPPEENRRAPVARGAGLCWPGTPTWPSLLRASTSTSLSSRRRLQAAPPHHLSLPQPAASFLAELLRTTSPSAMRRPTPPSSRCRTPTPPAPPR
jgi:hypothetical protein